MILEEKDVTQEIRTQEVAHTASLISCFSSVRKALIHRQHGFRKAPGLIADGRDMGTVVFPDATIKIFLDATLEERAHRRMLQLKENGFDISFKKLLSEIKERDHRDLNRCVAPLVAAKDALVIVSSSFTIEEMIEKALQYTYQKLAII